MAPHSFLRACIIGLVGAWLFSVTPAFADPITVGTILGISTLAASAVTFVVTTAITPSAMITGQWHMGGLGHRRLRLDAITPIGACKRSIGPFLIARTTGNCMGDAVGDMTYLLIDKRLTIRCNDLMTMKLHAGPMAGAVITKRFVEAYDGIVSTAQHSPPARLDFDGPEIEWAYRVRALSPSLIGVLWLMLVTIVRPRSHNERLAAERYAQP